MSEARFRLSRCTGVAKAHTLVVDNAHGQECQEQCPWAGRGDCVNDIVNLRRKTSSRELGSSKHGAKGRRRVDGGGHCIDGWPGRADKVYDSSSDGSRRKGRKQGLCLFRWTLRTGRRQTRVGGQKLGRLWSEEGDGEEGTKRGGGPGRGSQLVLLHFGSPGHRRFRGTSTLRGGQVPGRRSRSILGVQRQSEGCLSTEYGVRILVDYLGGSGPEGTKDSAGKCNLTRKYSKRKILEGVNASSQ